MGIDGLVDAETAGRLLGVSARRVNQLAASGEVVRATRGLYDRLSIERYLVTRRGTGGRAWDSGTAWAAVAILSGRRSDVSWLSDRSLYRLEAALRNMTPAELVGKARARASVHVFFGHPSVVGAIRRDVVARDWAIVGLAGATGEGVDGYLNAADMESVVKRFALVASTSGNITLRATDFDMEMVRSMSRASDVLVALDAAGSIDARTRGVGEEALGRALHRLGDRRRWSR